MLKKRILLFAMLFLGLSSFFLFFSGKHKTSAATVKITKGDIIAKVTAVGNIVSAKTAAVKSPISGIAAQLFHEEGDVVKKGEALLIVQPQPTPKDYATAKQEVETDLVDEKSALAEVKRYQVLLDQHVISKNDQEYAKATAIYKNARLKRELAEKVLALLGEGKASLEDQTVSNIISSPIDGFVVERVVNIGDPVIPQTDYQAGNVLFTIADMHSLIFKGQVSEADAAKLHLNAKAAIKIAALPDVTIQGNLSQLGLQSVQLNTQPTSSSLLAGNAAKADNSPFNVGYKVEVSHFSVPANVQLRAGYSATAEMITATAKNVLIIPERILQFENDKSYVWLIHGKNKPQKQFVTLGISDGINAQVLIGLKEGAELLEMPPTESEPKS